MNQDLKQTVDNVRSIMSDYDPDSPGYSVHADKGYLYSTARKRRDITKREQALLERKLLAVGFVRLHGMIQPVDDEWFHPMHAGMVVAIRPMLGVLGIVFKYIPHPKKKPAVRCVNKADIAALEKAATSPI